MLKGIVLIDYPFNLKLNNNNMKSIYDIIILATILIIIFLTGVAIGIYAKDIGNSEIINNKDSKQIDLTTLNEQNIIYWINCFELKEPDIVLAQIKLETGYLNSRVCLQNQNLFGLMKNKTEYYEFKHFVEGIIFYKYRIQNRYNPQKENYYQFLNRIGYAKDFDYIFKLKQINNK